MVDKDQITIFLNDSLLNNLDGAVAALADINKQLDYMFSKFRQSPNLKQHQVFNHLSIAREQGQRAGDIVAYEQIYNRMYADQMAYIATLETLFGSNNALKAIYYEMGEAHEKLFVLIWRVRVMFMVPPYSNR